MGSGASASLSLSRRCRCRVASRRVATLLTTLLATIYSHSLANPPTFPSHRTPTATPTPPQCPPLLGKLLLMAVKQQPNLGQFVCNEVMPALVANEIWSEKERWKGFLLLAKVSGCGWGALDSTVHSDGLFVSYFFPITFYCP